MPLKPTPEQVAAARLSVEALLVHIEATYPADDPRTANHAAALRTLLAATEPPTDIELAPEVPRVYSTAEHHAIYTHGYRAGARREGRR